MIYHLEGTIFDIEDNFIALKTAQTTYQVFIPKKESSCLEINTPISLYIYHHIKEDTQQLFGFETKQDKKLFTLLTSISGIGPKLGLKFLANKESDTLINAILSENIAYLTTFQGVGKKMAERLIIELKDKIANEIPLQHPADPINNPSTQFNNDLHLALKTLGYHQEEIKRGIKNASSLITGKMDLQEGIKLVLTHLNQ